MLHLNKEKFLCECKFQDSYCLKEKADDGIC